MEFNTVLKNRYACRKFSDKAVSSNNLMAVLEAGRIAPSAINKQPWRFLVLEGKDELAQVDAVTKNRYGAPVAILICFDKNVSAKNPAVVPDYGWVDCGLALMQMALEATNVGLASCIVGAYNKDFARSEFHIPEHIEPYQFLMLGYPDMGPAARHEERKPLEELIIKGSF